MSDPDMSASPEDRAGDRRTAARASLYLAASLYCDGTSFPVKIRNISAMGALLESRTAFARGSLVQLVRGSLIVHALVAWAEEDRLGLKFSGMVDVQQWRMTPNNAEQQRIDDIVRLVKAGAVPLPIPAPSCDDAADAEAPAADLQRAFQLLERMGDRLANDAIIVALYSAELQNLDIAMQVIDAVGSLLSSNSDLATDATKFASLRRSADQALNRAAA